MVSSSGLSSVITSKVKPVRRNGVFRLRFFLICFLIAPVYSLAEEEGEAAQPQQELDPRVVEMMKDPYFITLAQIGLTRDQVPEFKKLINEYGVKRQKAIMAEVRRNSPDIERRIEKRVKRVAKSFTKDMQKLLTEEQYTRFPPFRMQLEKKLMVREDTSDSGDENATVQPGNTEDLFR